LKVDEAVMLVSVGKNTTGTGMHRKKHREKSGALAMRERNKARK